MKKLIIYLVGAFVISQFIGCAKPQVKITETKPGSVIVDSSDYNEIEAKKLADTQCAKSKRHAQKISKSNMSSSKYHYFKCVF
ncbi:MAG: hypothetical protein CMH70_01860 [Nitrosomonadaceae bacterium]|nr:hypothetical protein [Nitrosomonadaceae bacterium]|tara:strand:+ start:223 stop:471 length:249 start_codon:yes stop_codon:yes gene_type:complete